MGTIVAMVIVTALFVLVLYIITEFVLCGFLLSWLLNIPKESKLRPVSVFIFLFTTWWFFGEDVSGMYVFVERLYDLFFGK
jgi:hypothetical protein